MVFGCFKEIVQSEDLNSSFGDALGPQKARMTFKSETGDLELIL